MSQFKYSNNIVRDLTEFINSVSGNVSSYFILSDENTHKYCVPLLSQIIPVNCRHLVIGAGEFNKNVGACNTLWKQLIDGGADRKSLIINVGGGMVTDIGGFVAATYMRGIRFINIPTSLLGMVDASSGGKTGIDIDFFKNMVGVFAFPETVIVAPEFLRTLPEKEWRNGIAEMLKHALIADHNMWNELSSAVISAKQNELTDELKQQVTGQIHESVNVKAEIVKKDPYEKHERKFLNFGHTIGHALESYSLRHDDHPLSHGAAVAIGLVCESYLSVKLTGLHINDLEVISRAVTSLFKNQQIHRNSFQEIFQLMKSDKKAAKESITMALLQAIGKPVIFDDVKHELILDSFHYYNSLHK